ncbi:MAG: hypothetical protein AUK43_02470 [Oscillatoriales cyanobacterium CG2_30_40_61]|nr:MAG: hypothetical protein AUK43_02470 [Oscillatoriales cyanobacterium CG2_30_40_61]
MAHFFKSQSLIKFTNMTLNPVLTQTYNQLSNLADSDNFWQVLETAFGTQYNQSAAETIRFQWQNHDFSQLPQVEILGSIKNPVSDPTHT